MHLLDQEPRWLTTGHLRHGMGVSFRCPHCTVRLAIWFVNPLDGGPPIDAGAHVGQRWNRSGADFDTLTLFPSINAKEKDPVTKETTIMHWHGFIHRGALVAFN